MQKIVSTVLKWADGVTEVEELSEEQFTHHTGVTDISASRVLCSTNSGRAYKEKYQD